VTLAELEAPIPPPVDEFFTDGNMSGRLGEIVKHAIHRVVPQADQDANSPPRTHEPPEVPYLADSRPRPLTPVSDCSQPPACFLLARLPPEIRREILVMAFGDRVLHMNLINEHPVVCGAASASRSASRWDGGNGLSIDTDSPERWTWSGCVCQRNHRLAACFKPEKWTGHWTGPWADRCLEARVKHSPEPRLQWPVKYQIGIMGWLRSCRQAYLEGIDVLYRTNMIHIQSKFLIVGIDRLIMPQRLASIAYLELNMRAGYEPHTDVAEVPGLEIDTLSALDRILDFMPGLKRIVLSITSTQLISNAWSPKLYTGILTSLDAFCRKAARRNLCFEAPLTLALPTTAVMPIRAEAERLASEPNSADAFLLWRRVEQHGAATQFRRSTYPRPPNYFAGSAESAAEPGWHSGYWIMEGFRTPHVPNFLNAQALKVHRHMDVYYPAFDVSRDKTDVDSL
jgi:hypothetical protein